MESDKLSSKWFICLVATSLTIGNCLLLEAPAHAETTSDDGRNYSVPMDADVNSPRPEIEEVDLSDTSQFELKRPELKALITVNKFLDPVLMEAQNEQAISLPQALATAIDHNLDIGIVRADETTSKWNLASAYGKFLPDMKAQYNYYDFDGSIPFRFLPGSNSLRLDGPFQVLSIGGTYYGYRGGAILFGALQARNNYRATKHQRNATIADVLLETSRRYYNLILSQALVQVQVDAVKTSKAQLEQNLDLEQGGLATHLDVLQAKSQLFDDRQHLIDQQAARRDAALDLASYLNIDQSVDLTPYDRILRPTRLISTEMPPARLLVAALNNRPELKQYEELRLAARKGMIIAAAPLQPDFHLSGNVYGIGSDKLGSLGVLNFGLNWNVHGLGAPDTANILVAKSQAREAMLKCQQQVNNVINQVRKSYTNTLSIERKLEETSARVKSAKEELRLAQLRFQYGVGKNIDILRAQQDVTSALAQNAQAMTDYNVSQIQLLRDCGLLNVDAATAQTPLSIR